MISSFHFKLPETSRWYRSAFLILFVIYIAAWAWTIAFSHTQRQQGISPVLPITHVADSSDYAGLADSLRSGRGFAAPDGGPETFRTPGYPAFLIVAQGLSGGSLFAATFLQVLLLFLTAFLIREIGAKVFSPLTGEFASLVFLLNPFLLVVTLSILSDIPFIFLFTLGIYIAIRYFERPGYRAILAVSLLSAIAVYIRPMGSFALPIFLAPLLCSPVPAKKKVIGSVIIVAVIMLGMVPWLLRNRAATGVTGFTSLKSYNLASYNVPLFLSVTNHTGIAQESARLASTTGIGWSQWRDLRYSARLDAYSKTALLSHPISYLKFHVISALPFFFSSPITAFVEAWYGTVLRAPAPSPKAAIFHLTQGDVGSFLGVLWSNGWYTLSKFLMGLIILLALYGAWKGRKNNMVWAFVFIIGYLALLAGPVSNIRYRLPVDAAILLLAVEGLLFLIQKRQSQSKGHF